MAYGLREKGVKKGNRVAVSLGNCWEFAALTYSLFKLGAILVGSIFKCLVRKGIVGLTSAQGRRNAGIEGLVSVPGQIR